MRPLRRFLTRLANFATRQRDDERLKEEIEEHLALQIAENLQAGLSPVEARRQAMLKFGPVEAIKEDYRAERGLLFIETLVQDIRFGLRMLRKSPGFTAVAVLTLALGIGANTAIFSATYSILLRPLPYKNSNRLVTLAAEAPGESDGAELSVPAIEKIESRIQVFEQVITVESEFSRLTGSGAPAVLQTGLVSGNYFETLGLKPLYGRTILLSDLQPSSAHVAFISYAFWQKQFRGDLGVVGKQINLADAFSKSAVPEPYTVIGIGPAYFQSPGYDWKYDVWIPRVDRHEDYAYLGGDNFTVARLKHGVTLEQANGELRSLSLALADQYPQEDKGWTLHAQRLQEMMVHRSRLALLILLGAAGFLLLIACVNVSNLSLARGLARAREIAIRKTLGATRSRVVEQLLTEALLLALLGCSLGLFLGYLGIDLLRANAPESTPRVEEIGLYAAVLWYAFGISVACGLAFGLAPALQVSGRKLSETLKGSGSLPFFAAEKGRRSLYGSGLIISEVALSVALLFGSVLMIRSFVKLISVPLGLRTDHILTMFVQLDPSTCKEGPQCNEAFKQMLARIRSLPGVQSAAGANYPPLEGGGITIPVSVEGQTATAPGQPSPSARDIQVDPSYFSVLGIPLLGGRNFTAADSQSAPAVGIVNQAFARKFLSGDALGKHLLNGWDKKKNPVWLTIVGLVRDARDEYPWKPPEPELYHPFGQTNSFPSGCLFVRTAMNPGALISAIREQVWAVSKNAPITDMQTMDQIVSKSVAEPRFQTFLLASFGGLGLILAVVGIYGVISYSVGQRTHEMGVRMALGAGRKHILRLVVGNVMLLTLAGIGIGLALSMALMRYLRSLLFEVRPTDPVTFVCVALLFLLVALVACYIPARRATKVDPMVALRYE